MKAFYVSVIAREWMAQQTGEFTATQLAEMLNENASFGKKWNHHRVITRILLPLLHEGQVTRSKKRGRRGNCMGSFWTIKNRAQAASFERGTQRIGTTPACVLTPSIEEGER